MLTVMMVGARMDVIMSILPTRVYGKSVGVKQKTSPAMGGEFLMPSTSRTAPIGSSR